MQIGDWIEVETEVTITPKTGDKQTKTVQMLIKDNCRAFADPLRPKVTIYQDLLGTMELQVPYDEFKAEVC